MSKITIIGAGVSGLNCAYRLHKEGFDVRVIDFGEASDKTSFGNAGFLSAFEKYPLSYPGVFLKTISLMLKGQSPIKIHPSLNLKTYSWLIKFLQNANKNRLKKTLALFEKYGKIAYDDYEDMQKQGILLDYHQDGAYIVYTQQQSYHEKLSSIQNNDKYNICKYEDISDNLGFVKDNISGVVELKRNSRLNPALSIQNIKEYLIKNNVEFINDEIIKLEYNNNKISQAIGKNTAYQSDIFIVATGINLNLLQNLNRDLMLIPTKGYSLTFDMPSHLKPKKVVMFNDLFTIITPRQENVRLTSRLEIGSTSKQIEQKVIDKILKNISFFTHDMQMSNIKPWVGFRPLTPNDMPLIGRDETYTNLIYSMGLGWLGMTFAPAIGRIVTNLIKNDWENKQSDDVLLFSGFYQGR